MRQFLQELQRRNVFRVALAYAAAAWVLIQVVETLFPVFGLSDAVVRGFVIVMAIGFIPAVVFAWAYELTPEGLKLERDVDRSSSITPRTGKKLDRIITVTLGLAVALFAVDKFVLEPARDAQRVRQAHEQGRSDAFVESFGNNSIAVLPFDDLSPSRDQAYFSEGLAEELLNMLASIPSLRVAARNSAFSYRDRNVAVSEIGQALKVAHVLEGSVRKDRDKIRVTAQLLEAKSDTYLWSESYDQQLDNIFDIQNTIAAQVVDKLRLTLLGAAPVATEVDLVAYEHYLKGNYFNQRINRDNLEKAVAELEKAVQLDADYAPAWVSLGVSYRNQAQYGYRDVESGTAQARQAITRALAIDPSDGHAWAALGAINLSYDWDFDAAAASIGRALELSPGRASVVGAAARLSAILGDYDTAITRYRRLLALEPLALSTRMNLGWTQLYGDQLKEAAATLNELNALEPAYPLAHCLLGQVFLLQGNLDAAMLEMQQETAEEWRDYGLALVALDDTPPVHGETALQTFIGRYGDAWAYQIAILHAQNNDPDAAFAWLDKAYMLRDSGMVWLLGEPFLRPLHSDPRWPALLDAMGLAHVAGTRGSAVAVRSN